MKRIFLNQDGPTFEWESFRDNEDNAYVETRPFVEVADTVDISLKTVEAGVLRDMTQDEIDTKNADAMVLAKDQALFAVDQQATFTRDRYRSQNKASTYTNKAEELKRWISDARPSSFAVGTYPYMEKEAARTSRTFLEMTAVIEATLTAWIELDSNIEAACLGCKHLINLAIDTPAILTAKDNGLAELNQL